jgi:iron complex outermembrane receptor protein
MPARWRSRSFSVVAAGIVCLTDSNPRLWAQSAATVEQPARPLPEVFVEMRWAADLLDSQKAAQSITTVLSNRVDAGGIGSVSDLLGRVPNLSATDSAARSFGDSYGIRGAVNSRFFGNPALVLYVDDVPYGHASSYSTELFAIERVDVWRGPQATVFGKNSEAGVVNVVTRPPANRHEAGAAAAYESFDFQDYRAAVLGPIVKDRLFFGVAGNSSMRDGFLDNTNLGTEPDTQDALAGRAVLRWTPDVDWDVTVRASGERFNDGTQRMVRLGGDPFKVASDFDGVTDIDANSQSLRIAHARENFTITSITSRREWNLDPFTLDLDLSPVPGNRALIRRDERQWSQELRLQSAPETARLKWRAGFFFSTSNFDGDDARDFIVEVAPGFFFPVTERTQFGLGEDNYAVFGQVTFSPADKLDVTIGARFDYTVKDIDRMKTSTLGPVPATRDERDFFTVAPKLIVDYRCTESLMVYGTTGLGFKPGGFSAFIDPPASPGFDTELAWANEIGLKSSWWEGKLSANVALFYYDIRDYQVERSVPNSTDLTIVNAPQVSSLGAELELTAAPIDGLELSAVLGYTRARFDRFRDPATGANLDGKRVPFSPEFTAALAAQYKHPTGLFARVEVRALGATFYDEANSGRLRQDSYALLDARFGYQAAHFSVALYGNNLTDTVYFTNKIKELDAGVPGAPQTVGVVASIAF